MLSLSDEDLTELKQRYIVEGSLANCMSFALDITDDYRYNLYDFIREQLSKEYSDCDEELESKILDFITLYCENLVGDRIRPVQDEDEVAEDEYLVLFRFDLNYTEWHFIRVYENVRLEKNGNLPKDRVGGTCMEPKNGKITGQLHLSKTVGELTTELKSPTEEVEDVVKVESKKSYRKARVHYLDEFLSKWLLEGIYKRLRMDIRTQCSLNTSNRDIGLCTDRTQFIKYLFGDQSVLKRREFDNLIQMYMKQYRQSGLHPLDFLEVIDPTLNKSLMRMYFVKTGILTDADSFNDIEIRRSVKEYGIDGNKINREYLHRISKIYGCSLRYLSLLCSVLKVEQEIDNFKLRFNLTDEAVQMLDMRLDRQSFGNIASKFNCTTEQVRDTLYPVFKEYNVIKKKKLYYLLLTNFNHLSNYYTSLINSLSKSSPEKQLDILTNLLHIIDRYELEIPVNDYRLFHKYKDVLASCLHGRKDTFEEDIKDLEYLTFLHTSQSIINKEAFSSIVSTTLSGLGVSLNCGVTFNRTVVTPFNRYKESLKNNRNYRLESGVVNSTRSLAN